MSWCGCGTSTTLSTWGVPTACLGCSRPLFCFSICLSGYVRVRALLPLLTVCAVFAGGPIRPVSSSLRLCIPIRDSLADSARSAWVVAASFLLSKQNILPCCCVRVRWGWVAPLPWPRPVLAIRCLSSSTRRRRRWRSGRCTHRRKPLRFPTRTFGRCSQSASLPARDPVTFVARSKQAMGTRRRQVCFEAAQQAMHVKQTNMKYKLSR